MSGLPHLCGCLDRHESTYTEWADRMQLVVDPATPRLPPLIILCMYMHVLFISHDLKNCKRVFILIIMIVPTVTLFWLFGMYYKRYLCNCVVLV